MNKNKKYIVLFSLLIIVLSFSGCSIKKDENKIPEIEKQKEIKVIDTDGDGLTDKEEEVLGTNISSSDSDADGLSDFEEVKRWKTNPLQSDTDRDGYSDGQEIKGGYDPLISG